MPAVGEAVYKETETEGGSYQDCEGNREIELRCWAVVVAIESGDEGGFGVRRVSHAQRSEGGG